MWIDKVGCSERNAKISFEAGKDNSGRWKRGTRNPCLAIMLFDSIFYSLGSKYKAFSQLELPQPEINLAQILATHFKNIAQN